MTTEHEIAANKVAKILGSVPRLERKEVVSQAFKLIAFAESTLGQRIRKPRTKKEKLPEVVASGSFSATHVVKP